MRKIWTLATMEWKRLFKKPQSYLIMFGMPLLFTFVFGALFSGGDGERDLPQVAIVDQDQSIVSEALMEKIEGSELMEVGPMSREEAEQYLADQAITGYLLIEPSSADKVPDVTFSYLPAFEGASVLSSWVDNRLKEIEIRTAAASKFQSLTGTEWEESFSRMGDSGEDVEGTVQTVNAATDEEIATMDNITARSAGFTIMFVMIAMLSSTGVLLEARKNGVWYRLMATPASKFEIMLGYLLAFFLIGWVQFGVLMAASSLIFGVYWGSVLGNIVLVSALLLCTIGLGLFIAGFVETSEQQSIYGNVIIFSTCMLGGVYWPIEIMPEFMQRIADFVPQTWAMDGFRELTTGAGAVSDILMPLAVLTAFTVVFLAVGMKRIRFE
ncbi:ABC transporter permease [Halobacillus litoralis]|uniref:ABC transporter permease n=1 Tax=Halobacillus litoralis TaxID=45668 RepID=UPI001CD36503|nr:ABC transporter permease [Halobacillus litoralis]MCA0970574.1 ABC transporter permease [Halobacillus litoralis]